MLDRSASEPGPRDDGGDIAANHFESDHDPIQWHLVVSRLQVWNFNYGSCASHVETQNQWDQIASELELEVLNCRTNSAEET